MSIIALGITTDGRFDYLHEAVASAVEHLPDVTYRYLVNDTGNAESGAYLHANFPGWAVINHGTRRGLSGAVWTLWEHATDLGAEFLFHLEDDFTFNANIDLEAMCGVLDRWPSLTQLVLKRQPWSPEEIQAGGQIETAPELYHEWHDLSGHHWVEHRRLFSFNPCLIPARTFAQEWGPVLESDVTATLNLNPCNRFAYWGRRDDPPLCHHIGAVRSAGYRW